MFSILNEIGNNSHFRTTAVVIASIGVSGFIYILVAITGYLSFGNTVSDNIVANYGPSLTSTIGKAAIVILVMFSYPLQVHPCRASIDAVSRWRPNRRRSNDNGSPAFSPPPKAARPDNMGEVRFATITAAILVASYIIAMTVSSLSKVLAYVGSTGSTSISFILPGLFYYKISSPDSSLHQRLLKEDDDEESEEDGGGGGQEEHGLLGGRGLKSGVGRRRLVRKLSLALAIYGMVVMVVCLVTNTLFVVAH
ncbi:uncharacterized protein KY384_000502 [Bacidia gigantensis]|uniref:uncharacterized protein n=1 Tax=Bacidia gigantensis TaxID=2732470 RepID=UPI001D048FA4|nr:uncharacterized protein KY384_000502 [Bacidia gigantensis]KAG8525742.1 hypothetical protein KY384_000502 [Bacidia gigantensis]